MKAIQYRANSVRRSTLRRMFGAMFFLVGAVPTVSSLVLTATPSAGVAAPAPVALPNFGVGAQSVSVPFAVGSVISVGVTHTCATNSSGALFCWGKNAAGQLGDGTTTNADKPVAIARGEMPNTNVSAVAAGEVQTCAVHTGEVYCWGQNASVQLGFIGTQQLTPKKVPNVSQGFQNTGVTKLTSSFGATCAIQNGKLFCWGEDDAIGGKLGQNIGSDVPSAIPSGNGFSNTNVSAASMGGYSACAVESGVVYCWGQNISGVLGNNAINSGGSYLVPVKVSDANGGFTNSGVTSVDVGGFTACAVKGGAVFCWGDGTNGILGLGAQSSNEPVAIAAPLDSGVTAVQVSQSHACALKSGQAYCWGQDINGTLGVGGDSNTPPGNRAITAVSAVTGGFSNSGVTSISNGDGQHSCAIYPNSAVSELACWGPGFFGMLGIGDPNSQTAFSPVTVCTTCASNTPSGPNNPSSPNNPPSPPGTSVTGVTVNATLTNAGLAVTFNGLPNLGYSDGSLRVTPVGATTADYVMWGLRDLQIANGRLTHSSLCMLKPAANNEPPITEAFVVGGNYEIRSFTLFGNGSPVDSNYPGGWYVMGGPVAVTIDPSFTGITGDCFGSPPGDETETSVAAPAVGPTLITEERQTQLTSTAGGAKVLVGGQLVEVSLTQASSTLRSSDPSQRTALQVTELQGVASSMLEQLRAALGGNTGSLSVRNTATGAVIIGLAVDPITGQPMEIPVENVVLVTGGGLVLMASGIDGQSAARIGLDGSIEIPKGGQVAVVAGGLTPGISGEVVVMSTPRLIGDFQVGASGDIAEQATLPTDLGLGTHTVVVTVGNEAASLGFRVVDSGALPALPRTGRNSDLITVWSLVFLVGGALVLAIDRRKSHLFR